MRWSLWQNVCRCVHLISISMDGCAAAVAAAAVRRRFNLNFSNSAHAQPLPHDRRRPPTHHIHTHIFRVRIRWRSSQSRTRAIYTTRALYTIGTQLIDINAKRMLDCKFEKVASCAANISTTAARTRGDSIKSVV